MGQNVQCRTGRAAPTVAGMSLFKRFRLLLVLPAALSAGCNLVLLHPAGAVAAQQGHLIVVSTILMLLVIVPVIALTFLFAWRYRKSNTEATYTPDWDHSTQLELMIWAAPLLIIIALGAVTWISTHTLDPYRSLRRAGAAHPVAADTKPLTVEVVALDWKWLFIYPEQGIAVVNELAAPANVPITFKITASSVMNSFFIPSLAGQIYAMPGMETQLHAVMNSSGDYDGFSANYSGAGFSDMRFKFHSMSAGDFEHWVQGVKAGGLALDRNGYLQLERPSEREPVRRYATVADGLYESILSRTVYGANLASNNLAGNSPAVSNPGSTNLARNNMAVSDLASTNPGARAP
jgi:cytochrome o ubiquinol oxidase subunit II